MTNTRKRDAEFIRDLLLEIEDGKSLFPCISDENAEMLGFSNEKSMNAEEAYKLQLHLDLLADAGFVKFHRLSSGTYQVDELTWHGHEFIDSIRDSKIWGKTKSALSVAGSTSLSAVKDIAVAFTKKELQNRFGLDF